MDYEALLELSEDEMGAGRTESAKTIVQKGLEYAKTHGNEACAALLEAELAYLNDDFETAVEMAEKAINLDGDEAFILRCTGVYLCLAGREDDGLVCFDRALRSNPDDPVTLREKGVTLAELGRLEEGLVCIERALEIKPDDPQASNHKKIILGLLGRTH